MNKKVIFGVTTVLSIGLVAVALANAPKFANAFAQSRAPAKTRTTVEFTSPTDPEVVWEESDGYYSFMSTGISSKGSEINLRPWDWVNDSDAYGSYIKLQTGDYYEDDPDTHDYYNDQIEMNDSYFMKLKSPYNNVAPMVNISVPIFTEASIIIEDSYLLYNGDQKISPTRNNEDSYYSEEWDDELEDYVYIYYNVYDFTVEMTKLSQDPELIIYKIHIEYMC